VGVGGEILEIGHFCAQLALACLPCLALPCTTVASLSGLLLGCSLGLLGWLLSLLNLHSDRGRWKLSPELP